MRGGRPSEPDGWERPDNIGTFEFWKPMGKNEKTSKRVASIAARVLRTSRSKAARSAAASALTQVADRKRKR